MRNLRIGIDAMGGDFAPDAVIKGVVEAIPMLDPTTQVVLFGDKEAIERCLKEESYEGDRIEIVATTEVITMHDHPAKAFQTKPDSSIRKSYEYLKAGKIDGIEAYHYTADSKEKTQKLLDIAQRYDLIVTGGSDFHGLYNEHPTHIGSRTTDDENLEKLFRAIAANQKK